MLDKQPFSAPTIKTPAGRHIMTANCAYPAYSQYLVMLALWEQSGVLVRDLERGVIVKVTKQGEQLKAKACSISGVIACALGMNEDNFVALHKNVVEACEHIRAYRLSMG